jgi:Zn-dependent peptidase ImmA (M78 family)
MLPEEKVALRFSRNRGLKPPVDAENLVRESAELEEDYLPADFDAVFLDKSANHPRPRVILAVGQPATRRRFTLAHELGHIIIPWHNGTHFCKVDGGIQLIDEISREIESEANRFAAELLMPADWIKALASNCQSLSELGKAVKMANVSYDAATIRLAQLLPTDFLSIEVEANGNIVRCLASAKATIQLPQVGSSLIRSKIDRLAKDSASFSSGSSRIFWWRLAAKILPPKLTLEGTTSSELLRRIATEVFSDPSEAKNAIMSVNGIVGSANGSNLRENRDLFTTLKQRFLDRGNIHAIVDHPSFEEFLARKAEELRIRHQ